MTDTSHSTGPDEFPTEEELPDDPPTADELDPFTEDPSDYDDINEFVREEHASSTD